MNNYFQLYEFLQSETAKKKGIDNFPSFDIVANLSFLVDEVLNPLREAYGAPIRISSGYRCEALNKAVNGASESGHLYGSCVDMIVSGDIRKFGQFVKQFLDSHSIKYDELIFEKSGKTEWLHFAWKGKDERQRMKCFEIVK